MGPARTPCFLATADERVLGLRGILVDRVQRIGARWYGHFGSDSHPDPSESPGVTTFLDYFSQIQNLCGPAPVEHSADSANWLRDTALRIMIADIAKDVDPVPSRAGT